jgi:hypothetical protein
MLRLKRRGLSAEDSGRYRETAVAAGRSFVGEDCLDQGSGLRGPELPINAQGCIERWVSARRCNLNNCSPRTKNAISSPKPPSPDCPKR